MSKPKWRVIQTHPKVFWVERRGLFGWVRSLWLQFTNEAEALEAMRLAVSPRIVAEAEG